MNSRGGPPILRGGPPLGTILWIKRYNFYIHKKRKKGKTEKNDTRYNFYLIIIFIEHGGFVGYSVHIFLVLLWELSCQHMSFILWERINDQIEKFFQLFSVSSYLRNFGKHTSNYDVAYSAVELREHDSFIIIIMNLPKNSIFKVFLGWLKYIPTLFFFYQNRFKQPIFQCNAVLCMFREN